jgi:hypothetical protein
VGGAVVLDDHRVVDRHVGGALLEVLGDRIAALAHDLGDQLVGLGHGGPGLVDEAPLGRRPALGVVLALVGIELADLELRPPLAALGELGLGLAAVAAVGDDAAVLGPEVVLQLMGPPAAHEQHGEHDDGDHEDRHDYPGHDESFPTAGGRTARGRL